jgi:hypothetical protein
MAAEEEKPAGSSVPPAVANDADVPDAAAPDTEIGRMLRSVYQQTVEEAIPDDLMDLLDKLK